MPERARRRAIGGMELRHKTKKISLASVYGIRSYIIIIKTRNRQKLCL